MDLRDSRAVSSKQLPARPLCRFFASSICHFHPFEALIDYIFAKSDVWFVPAIFFLSSDILCCSRTVLQDQKLININASFLVWFS